MAITFSNIKVEESSTITANVGTVTIARGSTNELQEILVVGDPQTAAALARVVAAPPASTEFGLIVRVAGGPSSVADLAVRAVLSSTQADNLMTVAPTAGSTWAVRPLQSSAADLQMTATPAAGSTWSVRPLQSSAADLQMTATPAGGSQWSVLPVAGSTFSVRPLQSSAADLQVTATPAAGSTWSVRPLQSSAADLQMTATPAAGSTWAVRPLQSSQADLRITAYQSTAADFQVTATPLAGSTWSVRPLQSSAADLQVTATPVAGSTWAVRIAAELQSTAAPSSNSSGVIVRQVVDTILTTASSAAFGGGGGSTSLTIQSSGANLRSYVTAYSITSTNQTPTEFAFYSSGTMTWPLVLAAISSAVSGVNLAVSAPAYLFRTAASEALTLQIGASSRAGDKVAVSYFRAP
jgi:hypothetical protein